MPLAYDLDTDAIRRTLKAVIRLDAELDVSPMGDPVRGGLARMSDSAMKHASDITHRDTATLFGSYDAQVGQGTSAAFATIFVSPDVVNPRGQRPVVYAPYEFGRGGDHDAFGRTIAESDRFVEPAIEYILNEAARKAR